MKKRSGSFAVGMGYFRNWKPIGIRKHFSNRSRNQSRRACSLRFMVWQAWMRQSISGHCTHAVELSGAVILIFPFMRSGCGWNIFSGSHLMRKCLRKGWMSGLRDGRHSRSRELYSIERTEKQWDRMKTDGHILWKINRIINRIKNKSMKCDKIEINR